MKIIRMLVAAIVAIGFLGVAPVSAQRLSIASELTAPAAQTEQVGYRNRGSRDGFSRGRRYGGRYYYGGRSFRGGRFYGGRIFPGARFYGERRFYRRNFRRGNYGYRRYYGNRRNYY